MDKYFSTHTLEKKRELGAYYTPRTLSQIMADWAIHSDQDRVLEPSFGGCGFLEACVETLTRLGSSSPVKQLYGADIDNEAFNFLFEKLGSLTDLNGKNFICKDFLETSTESYGSKFDVVIGNPPYVSMHKMTSQQKENCFNILKTSKFSPDSIGRNPSLWAFFLLHSLNFISQNGRAAWVLPSSFIHADYSKKVIDSYCRYFSEVRIFKLYERFFLDDGATEVSVIMLASGFDLKKINSCDALYSEVDNLSLLREKVFNKNNSTDFLVFQNGYKLEAISNRASLFYRQIQTESFVSTFGDFAAVKIGMVTGDNKTFVINKKRTEDYLLSEDDLLPVVSRFSQFKGLSLTKKNYQELVAEEQRVLLVCPKEIHKKNTSVRKYLSTVPRHFRKGNKTFPKRKYWFYPDDGIRADAFMSCMMHAGVRLVLNNAKINCTNSIHRVFFKEKISKKIQKAIVISMLSSLTQLSAEIEGRSYGSGVLKLEPTPAKKLLIILNESVIDALSEIYPTIDKLLVANCMDDARRLVDQTIADVLAIPMENFIELEQSIFKLRSDRYKGLIQGGKSE